MTSVFEVLPLPLPHASTAFTTSNPSITSPKTCGEEEIEVHVRAGMRLTENQPTVIALLHHRKQDKAYSLTMPQPPSEFTKHQVVVPNLSYYYYYYTMTCKGGKQKNNREQHIGVHPSELVTIQHNRRDDVHKVMVAQMAQKQTLAHAEDQSPYLQRACLWSAWQVAEVHIEVPMPQYKATFP
jgi:hypothetical protein